MKTKLIAITLITIAGIALLTAFKQSEGSKKYLTMTINGRDMYIIDENGVVTEKKIADLVYQLKGTIDVTKEINSISSKGYHLISHNGQGTHYLIFEKE
jgi:hypothetical protein